MKRKVTLLVVILMSMVGNTPALAGEGFQLLGEPCIQDDECQTGLVCSYFFYCITPEQRDDELKQINITIRGGRSTTTTSTTTTTTLLNRDDVVKIVENWFNSSVADAKRELEIIRAVGDYGCFYTSERKLDYYNKYKTLSPEARSCVKEFLGVNSTYYRDFVSVCGALNQDPITAFYVLDEYLEKGFAQLDCLPISSTATVFSGGKFREQSVTNQFCLYYPVKVPQGCIVEFQDKERAESAKSEASLFIGIAIMAVVVIGGMMIWKWTSTR